MDAKYLAEIEARCEAATPGPWKPIEKGNTVPSHAVFVPSIDGSVPVNICSGISPKTGNAAFISHSRADIPALLAEVERLNAYESIDLLPEQIEAMQGHNIALIEENAAKDQQIATLERALELAVEDRTSNPKAIKKLVELHIQQAQEQEGKK